VLVEQAERKLRGEKPDEAALRSELEPILARPDCDTLVLACTHFPLLNNEIDSIINLKTPVGEQRKRIRLVDSGEAIARRVEQLLGEQQGASEQHHLSLTTRDISHQTQFLVNLQARGLHYQGVISPTYERL
jgi:glutamate racemase